MARACDAREEGEDQISSDSILFTEQAVFSCLFLDIRAKKKKKMGGRAKMSTKIVHSSEVGRGKNLPFSLAFLRGGL